MVSNWPSSNKCYKDPRVIINGLRKISNNEIEGLKNFNYSIYSKFIKSFNVGGGLFGGNQKYIIKFIYLYYKAIKDFINFFLFLKLSIIKIINNNFSK